MILSSEYGCICGKQHLGAFWQGYNAFREEVKTKTAKLTNANIDSEIGRKLGMEKGKRYVIALLGEDE